MKPKFSPGQRMFMFGWVASAYRDQPIEGRAFLKDALKLTMSPAEWQEISALLGTLIESHEEHDSKEPTSND